MAHSTYPENQDILWENFLLFAKKKKIDLEYRDKWEHWWTAFQEGAKAQQQLSANDVVDAIVKRLGKDKNIQDAIEALPTSSYDQLESDLVEIVYPRCYRGVTTII